MPEYKSIDVRRAEHFLQVKPFSYLNSVAAIGRLLKSMAVSGRLLKCVASMGRLLKCVAAIGRHLKCLRANVGRIEIWPNPKICLVDHVV